jgi:hypothetical protein
LDLDGAGAKMILLQRQPQQRDEKDPREYSVEVGRRRRRRRRHRRAAAASDGRRPIFSPLHDGRRWVERIKLAEPILYVVCRSDASRQRAHQRYSKPQYEPGAGAGAVKPREVAGYPIRTSRRSVWRSPSSGARCAALAKRKDIRTTGRRATVRQGAKVYRPTDGSQPCCARRRREGGRKEGKRGQCRRRGGKVVGKGATECLRSLLT